MSATLSKTEKLQQHLVVQSLVTAYQQLLSSQNQVQPIMQPSIWLGCSGGRDSLGLAYACVLAHIPIQVIHVNHHLQAMANQWQALVENFCNQQHIPCHSLDVSLPNKTELAARKARFDAMQAHIQPNDVLLLAHHANDQAETVLMNLCKGAGLAGLAGMQTLSLHQKNTVSHWRWRPWLGITRAQITDFCQQAQLNFVNDPTNICTNPSFDKTASNANTRAILRQHVMPILHELFPEAASNITRSATNVAEAQTTIAAQTKKDKLLIKQQKLSVVELMQLPQARQHSLVSAWLQETNTNLNQHSDSDKKHITINATQTTTKHTQVYLPPRHIVLEVVTLAQQAAKFITQSTKSNTGSNNKNSNNIANKNTRIAWQQCQIKYYQGFLYILPTRINTAKEQMINLTLNQSIILPSGTWQIKPLTIDMPNNENSALELNVLKHNALEHDVLEKNALKNSSLKIGLSSDLLKKPFQIRPKIEGERVHIVGRVGSWPLKKFFQAHQIAPWQRQQAHILCADDANKTPLAVLCHAGCFLIENPYLYRIKNQIPNNQKTHAFTLSKEA